MGWISPILALELKLCGGRTMKTYGRFIIIFLILAVLSSLMISGLGYWSSKGRAVEHARVKAEMLHNYLSASMSFFKNHQRSAVMELLGKEDFYPELMLGFMVTRMTWDIFAKKNGGDLVDFSQATNNPLNESNRAIESEAKIISTFLENPSLPKQAGIIERNGEQHYFVATPVRVWNEKCLQCHGDPDDAPRFQTEMYGTEHGYGWVLEDVVSSTIVYVSMKTELHTAWIDAIKTFFISFISLLITLGLLLFFLVDRTPAAIPDEETYY